MIYALIVSVIVIIWYFIYRRIKAYEESKLFKNAILNSPEIIYKTNGYLEFEYYSNDSNHEIKGRVDILLFKTYLILLPKHNDNNPFEYNSVILYNDYMDANFYKKFEFAGQIIEYKNRDDTRLYFRTNSKINGILSAQQNIGYTLNLGIQNSEFIDKLITNLELNK